jgi:hypothetical protein
VKWDSHALPSADVVAGASRETKELTMTTTNRYEEIIVRNRAHRVRDLAFGVLLAVVTAFALGAIGTARDATAADTPSSGTAHACVTEVTSC